MDGGHEQQMRHNERILSYDTPVFHRKNKYLQRNAQTFSTNLLRIGMVFFVSSNKTLLFIQKTIETLLF